MNPNKLNIHLAHVGVNPEAAAEVRSLRDLLCDLGLAETKETPSSWFAGDGAIEILKEPGRGTKGHLAFYTSDLPATVTLLEQLGYSTDPASVKYAPDGSVRLIYLDREFNGFAVHLTVNEPF